MKIDDWLLEILACPACKSPLHAAADADELACTSESCGLIYPVRDDIPVLLVDEARKA
ncbi:Trm112 family protein [Microbispora sp. NPDC049125]|uniref:Trm112 family protein n=1 Tax=Microbispora sp. NPDC049125 TaxID=3154929 RepID=UPI0034650DF5